MVETEFAPLAALAGGALIGVASVLLMAVKGRIAGISGITVRLFPPYSDGDLAGRAAFVLGVIAAPLIWLLVTGALPVQTIEAGLGLLLIAGLLVGFGSVWGNGCTSGHGVCGMSRLSARSFVAVATFMTTAAITVYVTRHLV
ncbi:YeeE/YedE family protein [Fertoebacter nigrum]|uniref:YeeE/YedE family protein n=2 Tax=Fertoeibacter niger TaxID=2656921 RepID=A0A8X8HAE4_9RHOB|nr:YeeE/YedE family protein [Fertoeibacter niger]